jgi:hypothetical protein
MTGVVLGSGGEARPVVLRSRDCRFFALVLALRMLDGDLRGLAGGMEASMKVRVMVERFLSSMN